MPIIRFESVTIEFAPQSFGLRDVTFDVDPGEMLFITGHSGSGKTTLMRLLTKEYSPSTGDIYFHDEPLRVINKHSLHQHRRRIGVVFQDYRLVPEMNVWENIALPLYVSGKKEHEIEQRVTDLLNLIKLPEKAGHFPSQLSGGEAQRVSIARALAIGPEVIFADEPTGNLDPDTSRSIARLLQKINELGTTILVATHDQEVLRDHKAIRQIILEKGELIKDSGKPKSSDSHKKKDENENKEAKQEKEAEKSSKVANKDFESEKQSEQSEESLTKVMQTSVWTRLFGKKPKTSKETESESKNSVEDDTKEKESDVEKKTSETNDTSEKKDKK